MSGLLVCDNVYQLQLGWAMHALHLGAYRIGAVISIGDVRLGHRARDIAAQAGWQHLHVSCPPSFHGQLARAVMLGIRPPRGLRTVLRSTRALIIFNDTHPCTARIRSLCPGARVSLIEEGTGLHRSRPVGRLSPRRWLGGRLVRGLNVSGRQGEAPWVDELWVTQTHALTPAQQRKRVRTFDRQAAVAEMRRSCGVEAGLGDDDRPVLLLLGQPFVEDGVLTRRAFDSMLDALSAALGSSVDRMRRVYKPHPREREPRRSAGRALGSGVVMLDQHVPLETLDFGSRRLFVLSFTSGAVRQLGDTWRCVSVARCFPTLAGEIGDVRTYAGVTFLEHLLELPGEVAAFIDTGARRAVPEAPHAG